MLFTGTAGMPDFSANQPVLFFDDGARRDITIEAAKHCARHSAVRPLRTVFVNLRRKE